MAVGTESNDVLRIVGTAIASACEVMDLEKWLAVCIFKRSFFLTALADPVCHSEGELSDNL